MFVERKRCTSASGYHGCSRRLLPMVSRALIVLVSALLPILATASDRWQTHVPAPARGLPPVTVTVGEPGPYVSTSGTRLELSVAGSPTAFDGFAGVHFTVDGRGRELSRTPDLPVISRIAVRRGGHWTFATQVSLERVPSADPASHGIVVEWRDRTGHILGVQRAGVPPWSSPRPLRILRTGEASTPDARLLGATAFAVAASSLAIDAQWYQGVSAVVAPVDVWLDLPLAVREAIFASGRRVVFFGAPRSGQRMTPIDEALIPVVFEQRPSRTPVPWPYRSSTTEIVSPWSWRPKPGGRIAGSDTSPYLVSSAVATFAADEAALVSPLPSMLLQPGGYRNRFTFEDGGRPTIREGIREFRPGIGFVVLLVLSAGLWMALRRTPRLVVVAAAMVIGAAVVVARDWVRPLSGTIEWEELTPLTSSVQRHYHAFHDYAQRPLAERRLPPAQAHTTITGHGDSDYHLAEIRTTATAPGHGTPLKRARPAGAMTRWSLRHELGTAPRVRVQGGGTTRLEIDFESASAVDYVAARWECGPATCRGTARLDGARKGHATIADGAKIWPILFPPPLTDPDANGPRFLDADVQIFLIERRDHGLRVVGWNQRTRDDQSVRIEAPFQRVEGTGTLNASVVLPRKATLAGHRFAVTLPRSLPVHGITVTGEGGSIALQTGSRLELIGTQQYGAPPDALARIAPNGGILQIAVEAGVPRTNRTSRFTGFPTSLWLDVWENKQ